MTVIPHSNLYPQTVTAVVRVYDQTRSSLSLLYALSLKCIVLSGRDVGYFYGYQSDGPLWFKKASEVLKEGFPSYQIENRFCVDT